MSDNVVSLETDPRGRLEAAARRLVENVGREAALTYARSESLVGLAAIIEAMAPAADAGTDALAA